MKKLFTYLSVAVLAVAAVSCQKEAAVENPGDGNVTITLQTPGVDTKAIADGQNVDIVYYEIYKAEDGHKNSLTGTPLIDGTVEMTGKQASLSLNLLQGQTYVGLFWAQVDGKNYYNVTDLRNVQVNYPNEDTNKTYANDEARAAFCKAVEFGTGRNVTVTLERPFAQINLGTTIADLTDDYTITLEQSSMTVKGVANSFNVAAMTAGETEVNVEFSYATLPYVFNPSETLVANNQTWAYAGMNYVLVPGDAATVDVTYSIKTDVGTVTRNVPVVPVQKNYRTNLLGNLLTQETAIEIVVDERFADYEDKYEGGKYGEIDGQIYVKVESAEELVDAVADPNVDMVILVDDITVESQIQIYKNLVLDLNGKTLTAAKDGAELDAIWVRDNAEVVITGNGTINATYDAVFATGTSKLTIENGTFIGVAEAVYAQANATVIINGGSFKSTEYPEFTLNLKDSARATASITVYGGTFYQFNPADNAAEGAGTDFVADGYKSVENGAGVYTVIPNSAVIAADNAAVETALDDAAIDTIYLNAGEYTIEMYTNFTDKESLTIVGTEGTKVAFKNLQVQLERCKNFTIKNCEVLHMATKSWGMLVFGSRKSSNGVVTISNCIFNGVGTQGIYINEEMNGAVYNIENCTFNGDFGSEGAITIQDNADVEFTVNVNGCAFNNIPDTSHEVCLIYGNDDFTLNSDVELEVYVK